MPSQFLLHLGQLFLQVDVLLHDQFVLGLDLLFFLYALFDGIDPLFTLGVQFLPLVEQLLQILGIADVFFRRIQLLDQVLDLAEQFLLFHLELAAVSLIQTLESVGFLNLQGVELFLEFRVFPLQLARNILIISGLAVNLHGLLVFLQT